VQVGIINSSNTYTLIRYATDAIGTGSSSSPTDKTYIGLKYGATKRT